MRSITALIRLTKEKLLFNITSIPASLHPVLGLKGSEQEGELSGAVRLPMGPQDPRTPGLNSLPVLKGRLVQ